MVEVITQYKSRTFDQDITAVETLQGVEEISNKLKTDLEWGLNASDFPARKIAFGNNE